MHRVMQHAENGFGRTRLECAVSCTDIRVIRNRVHKHGGIMLCTNISTSASRESRRTGIGRNQVARERCLHTFHTV